MSLQKVKELIDGEFYCGEENEIEEVTECKKILDETQTELDALHEANAIKNAYIEALQKENAEKQKVVYCTNCAYQKVCYKTIKVSGFPSHRLLFCSSGCLK